MAAGWLPIFMFTLIWALIGGVAPRYVPNGPHKQLIQMCLLLTAICCWMFWFLCYIAQMNPLIGPDLDWKSLAAANFYWGKFDE